MTSKDGRVALIPGGTRGIGRAIALSLAASGWRLALAYREDRAQAEQMRRELDRLGCEHLISQSDAAQPLAAQQFVEDALSRWQRVDALINAVGSFHRRPLVDENPTGWRRLWADNLDTVFNLCHFVAPEMQRAGYGRIINFGVVNAESAPPAVAAHHLAKDAVKNLGRALARALANNGITVNTLALGFIEGGASLPEMPKIPAGRLGKQAEVVSLVRYLLSDEAAYVNGAEIAVSGAWGI